MIYNMNTNQECELVSDLLPLYVEHRTGKESDEFIRAHLEQCEECRRNLNYMEISYEDLWQKPVKCKKKAAVLGRVKRKWLVYGYWLVLLGVWVYIIRLFGTIL